MSHFRVIGIAKLHSYVHLVEELKLFNVKFGSGLRNLIYVELRNHVLNSEHLVLEELLGFVGDFLLGLGRVPTQESDAVEQSFWGEALVFVGLD